MGWLCYIGGMNIYCEWNEERMHIKSGKTTIGYVELVSGEPVLTLIDSGNPSLTFGEIEFIMDNWHNLPKA